MKLFQLSITGMMVRFYMMMVIILIAGFTGLWFLSALALPVFFSALMGFEFGKIKGARKVQKAGQRDQQVQPHQISAHL